MLISSQDSLSLLCEYFSSLGLENANDFFSFMNFSSGIIIRLPAVCLLPDNKPASSRSKQTHIHVTGENRYFFFDRKLVDYAIVSSADYQQPVLIAEENIEALTNMRAKATALSLKRTFTCTKIACRTAQDVQVQISKIREDGNLFIELRKKLYENDLLVFLKYRNSTDMFVAGIPYSFYGKKYTIDVGNYHVGKWFEPKNHYDLTEIVSASKLVSKPIPAVTQITTQKGNIPSSHSLALRVGDVVKHITYGFGIVQRFDGNTRIIIDFNGNLRTLAYPMVVENGIVIKV